MNRNAGPLRSLLGPVALAAAGATTDFADLDVKRRDRVGLWVKYTTAAASTTGFPRLTFRWDNGNDTFLGVVQNGHTLEDEFYDLPTPGAASTTVEHVIEIIVPPGAEQFQGQVQEQGDTANPGTVDIRAVSAWPS